MKKKKLIKLAVALSLIAVVLFISYVYISPIYNKELINNFKDAINKGLKFAKNNDSKEDQDTNKDETKEVIKDDETKQS